MGGSHSTCGKNHVYEEINDKQFEQSSRRFDRKESTHTLDVRVEDLGKNGRGRLELAGEEWGNEDEKESPEDNNDWMTYMGWGQEDVKKMRTRKRGAISNVKFYENTENHIYDNETIEEVSDDDFELEKTPEIKTVKYKRCKSIDIKVLDAKDGETIEF